MTQQDDWYEDGGFPPGTFLTGCDLAGTCEVETCRTYKVHIAEHSLDCHVACAPYTP